MIIELIRAHTPADIGEEETCGICARRFRTEAVLARLTSEWRDDMGRACPSCVALMGRYLPEKFPTIDEYEEALRNHPRPVWPSVDELIREEEEGGASFSSKLEAAELPRSPK